MSPHVFWAHNFNRHAGEKKLIRGWTTGPFSKLKPALLTLAPSNHRCSITVFLTSTFSFGAWAYHVLPTQTWHPGGGRGEGHQASIQHPPALQRGSSNSAGEGDFWTGPNVGVTVCVQPHEGKNKKNIAHMTSQSILGPHKRAGALNKWGIQSFIATRQILLQGLADAGVLLTLASAKIRKARVDARGRHWGPLGWSGIDSL